jgi:hypothetical protein
MITIQSVSDVIRSVLIACCGDWLASVGDDFVSICMDREIFGLKRLLFGHGSISVSELGP